MTPAEFEKALLQLLTKPMTEYGFRHEGRLHFTRARGEWRDIVFFDLERASGKAFCVVIGLDVPVINNKIEAVAGSGAPPAPIVHRYLGETGRGGFQKWYRFGKADELSQALGVMLTDFRSLGISWLDSFRTLAQVVHAFYETRVGSLADGASRPADPAGWAIYGWLLDVVGDNSASRQWLERARAELAKPLYMKGGRLLSEPAPGATLVERPAHEVELARILGAG